MAMKTSDLFVILLIVMLLYWLSTTDDDNTQPSITLQNKCELLIKNTHDVPKHVIEYCKNILEKENDD